MKFIKTNFAEIVLLIIFTAIIILSIYFPKADVVVYGGFLWASILMNISMGAILIIISIFGGGFVVRKGLIQHIKELIQKLKKKVS